MKDLITTIVLETLKQRINVVHCVRVFITQKPPTKSDNSSLVLDSRQQPASLDVIQSPWSRV